VAFCITFEVSRLNVNDMNEDITNHEAFIYHYDVKVFSVCAEILHQEIDAIARQSKMAPLPAVYQSIFEDWIELAYQSGIPISNRNEVVDFFRLIFDRVQDGPGNPTVNN